MIENDDDSDEGNGWLGALLMAAVTAAANLWSQHETNKQNRELADLQYQRSIEQVNLQNEYNSESARMKRLADAGLNPLLIYGGSYSGSSQQSLPQYQAPTMRAPQFDAQSLMNMASIISTLRTQAAQREVLKQQAAKDEQQANYIWTQNVREQYRTYLFALMTGQRPTDLNDIDYSALLHSPVARKYSSEYNTRVSQGEMYSAYASLTKLNKEDRETEEEPNNLYH